LPEGTYRAWGTPTPRGARYAGAMSAGSPSRPPLRAAPIARATGGMIAGILRGSQDIAGEDLPFDRSSTEVVEDRPS
jgi:hypothetical protein